jgi:hypothetical protein
MEAVGSDEENPLLHEFEKVVADHKADDVKISYLALVRGKNRRK